jgi:hypothetical protein
LAESSTLQLATSEDVHVKQFLPFCFLLLLSLSASALENGHAKYVGGTLSGVAAGSLGRLDTTSDTSLIFVLEHAGKKVEIPYAAIESHKYSKEVARHLGVLPTIAVGLLKVRQHRHFFRISYRVPGATAAQVVIFEVPKQMPRTLEAILQTRAPSTWKPNRPAAKPSGDFSDDPHSGDVPCDCLDDVALLKLP